MHALVVFESLWGNTAAIARAIADGLGPGTIELLNADDAPLVMPSDLDLLVVGGPTHAFSMSTEATRESARQQGPVHLPDRGIREWIAGLAVPARPLPVATFDTRTVSPRLPGSAAKKALKRLVALGFRPVARAETFGVHGYEGPLAEGELERAVEWGRRLAGSLA